MRKEKVTPFDYFNEEAGGARDNFGIFTLDGEKQAKAFPFWEHPYKAQEAMNKEYVDIAMETLNKKLPLYFIDEIGDR